MPDVALQTPNLNTANVRCIEIANLNAGEHSTVLDHSF